PRAMAPLLADFEKATAAARSGDTRGALLLLQTIVDRDPANSVFRGALALAKRQAGELDAAAKLYREAVALAPADADAWYNLGVTLHESGKDKEALAALDEAVKLDPNRAEAH